MAIILISITACSGLKMGVGLKICIDEKDIYDIGKKKAVFTSPCSTLDMFYLGKWNNLAITLAVDAQTRAVTFAELYNTDKLEKA